ncbi:MAG: TonB-dependent receptor, partial [Bacteroidales bacterium]|nr:TonB-dependent receptor [Bacteroidales bacterium]
AAAIDYKHNFGREFSSKTALIYSKYDFTESMDILKIKESFDGYLQHQMVREDFLLTPTENQKINFGFQFDHVSLKSGEFQLSNGQDLKECRHGNEISFWVGEDLKTNFGLELSFGARGVIFNALGGNPYYTLDKSGGIIDTLHYGKHELVKSFFAVEPRFSAKLQLSDNQSLKAGYCRTSQHVQNILNNGMSSPIGRSVLSSNIIKPQTADQVSVGYMADTKDKKYEFSVEAYYKQIDNVYDYKDGKNLVTEIEMERLLSRGEGRAYGVEFYVKKNVGDFSGWFSYTLSWSENKVEGVNNEKWYTASNDRRHDVSIVAMYKLNHKWDLSATWVYTSGQALTAPSAKYDIDEWTHYYYNERNGYRAPAYHRLDFGINNTKERPKYTRVWSFGVYNLYNHYNPYVITFENDDTKATGTRTEQVSLFGIIPSVTYTIKF